MGSRCVFSDDRKGILYRFRESAVSAGKTENLIRTYRRYSIHRARKIADLLRVIGYLMFIYSVNS